MTLETVIWTSTDSGTIALFEPTEVQFEEYFADEPYTYLTYMKEGKLLLVNIGGDGSVGMSVRFADALPAVIPKSAVQGRLQSLSGRLFFGAGESLPQNDEPFDEPESGEWLDTPRGNYHYILSSVDEIAEDDVSLNLTLIPVKVFDAVPYPKGGDMPSLEG